MANMPLPGTGARLINAIHRGRVAGRQKLADAINFYGGAGQDKSTQEGLHRGASRNLVRLFGQAMNPEAAATMADLSGLGNEALSGSLQALIGEPFFSPKGFDWQDVAQNRSAQDEEVARLRAAPPTSPLPEVVGNLSLLNPIVGGLGMGRRFLGKLSGD